MSLNKIALENIIREALKEDLGFGDLTSALFESGAYSRGQFVAKAEGVLAGVDLISGVYRQLDSSISVKLLKADSDLLAAGDILARVEGSAAALLNGERVILNFLQHLSGIATATNRAVTALEGSSTRICDTRKTLPGLRMLQKYAVRCGGGHNHRFRLDDGVMIKDNHIEAAGSISEAVKRVRNRVGPMVVIEVETETEQQVLEAVEAGVNIIMFDNRSPEEVRGLVRLVPDSIVTEVSGGITLEKVDSYADTGVDYISMGSLTHSVTALDISFILNR